MRLAMFVHSTESHASGPRRPERLGHRPELPHKTGQFRGDFDSSDRPRGYRRAPAASPLKLLQFRDAETAWQKNVAAQHRILFEPKAFLWLHGWQEGGVSGQSEDN
jgi:hypothetical protein